YKLSLGKLGIAGTSLFTNEAIAALPPRPGIDLVSKYLFHALKTVDYLALCHGAVKGKCLNRASLNLIPVPYPAPSEQRRIVEILDQADALRKKRAEADAKAARILPALFYKMFGDPATNPKRWPTDKLGNLFDVIGGGTPSKSVPEYWEGDIPWVSPKDMKFDVILDTEDHITPDAIRNSATRLINQGAVLVVYRSGILAHSFPVAIAGRDVTINQDLKALTSKSEVRNEYLFGLLSALPSIGLSCVKKGATVHNIDGSRFLGLKIPRPSKTLQDEFAVHLETLLTHKEKRHAVGEQIEKLFSVLLYRAFTGDLTAQWREAHMKELLAEMEQQAKALETPVVEKRVPKAKSKRHAGRRAKKAEEKQS
ncbi:MAG: restriction endonuclease subunit S, partial [Deltaproteobacteria bacterium]|nr:restriction endonuclease subunit S [Deltaproteobacteria bacterium]